MYRQWCRRKLNGTWLQKSFFMIDHVGYHLAWQIALKWPSLRAKKMNQTLTALVGLPYLPQWDITWLLLELLFLMIEIQLPDGFFLLLLFVIILFWYLDIMMVKSTKCLLCAERWSGQRREVRYSTNVVAFSTYHWLILNSLINQKFKWSCNFFFVKIQNGLNFETSFWVKKFPKALKELYAYLAYMAYFQTSTER